MKQLVLAVIVMFGIVDQIQDDYASIEYTNHKGELQYMDVPVSVFPCDVKEGLAVTFSKSGNQTKINCKN